MVLSISSRVFVGESLCRDSAWLEVVSAYLAEVVSTANALRPYPSIIRPILRPFLAPKSRMASTIARAQDILDPAIEARQKSHDRYLDVLGFLVSTTETEETLPVILKLLVLMSAAVSPRSIKFTTSTNLKSFILQRCRP